MPSLHLHDVQFAYLDSVPLFEHLCLDLDAGWTGLVGENGTGKTTLLRLLTGELDPDAGQIRLEPRRLRVLKCTQTVSHLPEDVVTFAAALDGPARVLHGKLALEPEEVERWPTLSPGQRKRWQIGAALWAQPEVLLLDEPTNHLDSQARALLISALRSHRGVGLVVSHDRELLDGLTIRTVRFHGGRVQLYRGGWSTARLEWEAEEASERDAYRRLQAERRQVEKRLADARRERDSAQASRSAGKRKKGPKDRDQGSILASTRVEWAEGRVSRRVQLVRRELSRLEDEVERFQLQKERGRSLFVSWQPSPSPVLVRLDLPELTAGPRRLLGRTQLVVRRDERVRICGANGVGKTTLLEALRAHVAVSRDRLLYLPQELAEEDGA
ncbi:MAG: ABC-F family ATP-binding cassette domain-containing protein, partial [Deltaproteobacteria bacterium]|nr:ABC-F family ATP-binding cassette domain-containing protein [Deltaproteobacteria bacterium]